MANSGSSSSSFPCRHRERVDELSSLAKENQLQSLQALSCYMQKSYVLLFVAQTHLHLYFYDSEFPPQQIWDITGQ